MPKVIFSDGRSQEYSAGETFFDILKTFDKKLLKKSVALKVNGVAKDLGSLPDPAAESVDVEPVLLDSAEGLDIYRHSASHILAEAVTSLFDGVKLGIGPTINNGFYYDFGVEKPFTPEDLVKIDARMREIIKGNFKFEPKSMPKAEAIEFFKEAGQQYKVEIIADIPDDTVGIYTQDGFTDLCRGPHLPSTGYIQAFKLTSAAGAYWRGDEKNRMLQRIYATAWGSKAELKEHLRLMEEAKKRDHRKIGKALDLFSTSDEIGSGLVLWHPKGAVIRGVIEDFWKSEHKKSGYDIVYTPHLARVDLWKTSGHWDFYQENLFSPMDLDGQEYIVRPMNCPFHIEIYKSHLRSYRDLPIKYAELGTVYRYERSGVLHGLLRVRGFTQDDAHLFTTPDQLEGEIGDVLDFTLYVLKSFGFNEFDIYLSTRPDKYVGSLDDWASAESALKGALDSSGLDYMIDPGEGVFYGPKIDIKIKDVIGRSWQCSTIQVDFNLPERFNVTYRDEQGGESRPIMIHRALMGSLERFFGCLIEHYAGAFPLWLAPVQLILLTVTDKNTDYAKAVQKRLRRAGFRVELDNRNEKLGFKIRESELQKIPYSLVIGDKEVESETLSPRSKAAGTMDAMAIDDFIELITKENVPQGGELS